MSRTWCPHCSKPNLYEIEKPRFCGSCSKDMTTAFQTTPVSQPPGTPQKVVIASEQPILRRPQPLYAPEPTSREERSADDYFSPERVQSRAAQLTASLRGGFNISLASEGTSMKLGTLDNVREAFTQAEASESSAPAKKTRSRKR